MTQNRGAINAVDTLGSTLANMNSRLGALEVVAHTPCTCANCITVCTSTTRPSSPFDGQTIYETNTDNYMTWNGSAWVGLQSSTLTASSGPIVSRGTAASTGIHTGVAGSPAKLYSTSGDNFNLRTHTNTPNPNFSLGVQNGSGTDTAVPIGWENDTLRLRGSGTGTFSSGLYVDSANVPRYAQMPNVYGWHAPGEQVGTQTVIGAWAANGMGWSAANAWITVGSVGITIPTGSSVIVMHYGFTMFVQAGGPFLVRVYYNGGATAVSDFQYFRNNTFDHFAVVGPRGLGIQPGTSGTIFLQVYGQGITLTSDANDSGYFVVTTV